jgi:hypothetical protein
MSNGKGDTPRPLSVTPDTYAANYARIRWTETPETFCPPLRDPVQDSRETMRQRHLEEAKIAINGAPCAEDWPARDTLPTTPDTP